MTSTTALAVAAIDVVVLDAARRVLGRYAERQNAEKWLLARIGQALVIRIRATRTGRFTIKFEIIEVLDFEIVGVNPPDGKERRKNSPLIRSWFLPMCPPC